MINTIIKSFKSLNINELNSVAQTFKNQSNVSISHERKWYHLFMKRYVYTFS